MKPGWWYSGSMLTYVAEGCEFDCLTGSQVSDFFNLCRMGVIRLTNFKWGEKGGAHTVLHKNHHMAKLIL